MNIIRLIIAVLATMVLFTLTNYAIHEVYLQPDYLATAANWRERSVMEALMHYMIIGNVMISLALVLIYTQFARHNVLSGMLFGLFMGLIFAGNSLGMYAIMPVGFDLIIKWMITGILQMVLIGTLVGLIYKR